MKANRDLNIVLSGAEGPVIGFMVKGIKFKIHKDKKEVGLFFLIEQKKFTYLGLSK
jgi:hypothetical protein